MFCGASVQRAIQTHQDSTNAKFAMAGFRPKSGGILSHEIYGGIGLSEERRVGERADSTSTAPHPTTDVVN